MVRMLAPGILLLAVVVAAVVLLARQPNLSRVADLRDAAPESRAAAGETLPARAESVRSRVVPVAPETRVGPERAPHRGVRGIVTSPGVTLPDGSPGVDPGAWEATVYALVSRPERRTVDRIGILKRNAPRSPAGDFEIDLPTGPHLLLIQHRIQARGGPLLLEGWYAYVDVATSHSTPVDLGRHSFAADAVRGIVLDERGAPCGGIEVGFSNEVRNAGDPLTRGVHLISCAGNDGRFAMSLACDDRAAVVGCVSARSGGAGARRDGVRMGDAVELILKPREPEAEVVFEIPWSPELRLWILGEDRDLGFFREGGRAPAGGIWEERRTLPLGRYAVELLRGGGASPAEWARAEVAVTRPEPQRIPIEPVFRPARTLTGRTSAGTRVAWVTRIAGGSCFVREETTADRDGRFALRAVPTAEVVLRTGSVLTRVPPGSEPTVDVGDLASR